MSEAIKEQAQKVYEIRQVKNTIMSGMRNLSTGTAEWSASVDDLRDTVNKLSHEEALLSSLVIEDQLGKFSV